MNSFAAGLLVAAIVACGLGAAVSPARSRPAATALLGSATVLVVGATGVLLRAILRQDYGIEYVALQSRADSSTWYRVAALWSGAEGSLLLFTAMLSVVVLVAHGRHGLAGPGWVAACLTLGMLVATVTFVANPFSAPEIPDVAGAGLTPILEHPAMIYHPPILYAGLVATAVPFLQVLSRRTELSSARRWALLSWTLLTIGLATGANWAYVELGWGGYWAWDPVENTVLLPWLVLTAALHQWHLPSWPAMSRALLGAPFVLVAFGAAVTRSGGLSSVHVFADAESIGVALGLLVSGLGLALVWHIVRWPAALSTPDRASQRRDFRTTMLQVSVAASLFMATVVLLGVGFPLLPGNDRILDRTYYTSLGAPLLVCALAALALAASTKRPEPQLLLRFALGLVVGVVVAVVLGGSGWFAIACSGAIGAALITHLRRAQLARPKLMMTLAHLGIVVLSVGVVGSSQAESTRVLLEPGESVQLAGYTATYRSFAVTDGPRANSEQSTAAVAVVGPGTGAAIELYPGLVSYPDRAVVLAETSLHSTPFRDVQVVMRTIAQDGAASFDVAVRPGVMQVWWGTSLIVLAGIVGLVQRGSRRRYVHEAASAGAIVLTPLAGEERVER